MREWLISSSIVTAFRREKALSTWTQILHQLGRETNNYFGNDRITHVTYRRYYNIADKYTPRAMKRFESKKNGVSLEEQGSQQKASNSATVASS